MKSEHGLFSIVVIAFLSFSALKSSGQVVYHVDPNDQHPLIPQQLTSDISTRIILWNGYNQPITILSADEPNSKWQSATILNSNYVSFQQKSKYVKIFTTKENYKTYNLTSGKI